MNPKRLNRLQIRRTGKSNFDSVLGFSFLLLECRNEERKEEEKNLQKPIITGCKKTERGWFVLSLPKAFPDSQKGKTKTQKSNISENEHNLYN